MNIFQSIQEKQIAVERILLDHTYNAIEVSKTIFSVLVETSKKWLTVCSLLTSPYTYFEFEVVQLLIVHI